MELGSKLKTYQASPLRCPREASDRWRFWCYAGREEVVLALPFAQPKGTVETWLRWGGDDHGI